jgi:hypothetical protein
MGKVFLKRGDILSQANDNFTVQSSLDRAIYQINQNPQTGELFLERIANEFYFGFKLYGIDETLVKHVLDTYEKQSVKKNIGVLLNGAKGTGKTVTAKVLANKLGLPIIICDRPYGGLSTFLASINQDCIFFFDEFEKNFRLKYDDDDNEDAAGEDLLSIMDGVYNSNHCHIFLLTTNKLKVNDNLISRPSRIRYLKSFNDVLDNKVLNEFIDDNLIYPEYKQEIIEYVDTLTIATIDIIKSIIEEVNIHKCGIDTFKHFFNVKEAMYKYYVRSYDFYLTDSKEFKSKDVFLKTVKASYNEEVEYRPNFRTIRLKKNVKKLKVGDYIERGFSVLEIDMENQYILARYEGCGGELRHYFIEDIDTQPSLFSSRVDYAYEYNDYW